MSDLRARRSPFASFAINKQSRECLLFMIGKTGWEVIHLRLQNLKRFSIFTELEACTKTSKNMCGRFGL